jgi:hypothetical protein
MGKPAVAITLTAREQQELEPSWGAPAVAGAQPPEAGACTTGVNRIGRNVLSTKDAVAAICRPGSGRDLDRGGGGRHRAVILLWTPAVTDVVSPSTLNAKVNRKEIRTRRVALPADAL